MKENLLFIRKKEYFNILLILFQIEFNKLNIQDN